MNTKTQGHSVEFIALCDDAKLRVKEISTDEVKEMIDNNESFCLIDVRENEEFSDCHLTPAKHINKSWIEAKIHELVNDKNTTIVLYCGSGNRSVLAGDNLKKMGYKNTLSMAGGIKKWLNEKKPVCK